MKRYLIWLVLISLIVIRYLTTRPIYHNGDSVRITATVYSDPITYTSSQGVKIAGLTAYLPNFPEINYGDKVIVEGIVNNGPAGGVKKLDNPKLIKIETLISPISLIRNKIVDFYQSVLPQPMSGALAGVTLGDRGAIMSDFWQKIKNTGVVYMVSASGLKIALLISFFVGIATYFLPRRKAIPFVILGTILYLFIAGFSASIVRGAIMSLFVFLGQESGRLVSKWRILLLTAGIMLVIQPDWAVDIGFILSFVALASIMLFAKRIEKLLKFLPKFLGTELSVSLAAQIGMSPILFVTFGQFNIWSPVVNVLTLWTVPYIMILGSGGGIVGLVIPMVGKSILFLSYPLLWYFVKIVSIFNF